MNGNSVVGEQLALVISLVSAFAVALLYLRWRGHASALRRISIPALGVVVLSVPDALLTLRGTWGQAPSEANPFIALFLRSQGHWGLCLAFPAWMLAWTLFLDGLETLRSRLPRRSKGIAQLTQLYTAYALAMGHLDGLTSWTHSPSMIYHASSAVIALLRLHGPWPLTVFPLGYVLYPSLVFGAVGTLAHLCVQAGESKHALAARARMFKRILPSRANAPASATCAVITAHVVLSSQWRPIATGHRGTPHGPQRQAAERPALPVGATLRELVPRPR